MIENEINHQESTKNHFKFSKICHNDLVRGSLVPLVLEDVYCTMFVGAVKVEVDSMMD